MTLLLLPIVPLIAALPCFATHSRTGRERLNFGAIHAIIRFDMPTEKCPDFWLPGPIHERVSQTTQIIGGAS